MILIDANLILYAFDADSAHHVAAKRWFEEAVNGDETVGLPLVTVLSFIRLMTDQRLFASALTLPEAVAIVQDWLAQPNIRLVSPTDRHWGALAEIGKAGQARGPMTTDAHLAALAVEHGATLATNDRGFARFPKLKVRYPLAG